ncbi:hypothetical protein [Pandoraea apista]|uniref:hypothetical protein n=1 Tax=Pandoraea apista TaxID=93218 RepID=UPI000F6697F3|nr:hypothetical protein [Pandoraea apista]RRW87951.1 hypothetical protein EGJ54_24985 [Pandoraea apista]RRW96169.1 hypothetical protein EGJ56_25380 [Pandoraea apista]
MTRVRPAERLALWLAVAATATAISISVIAGGQRGGMLAERVVWVTLGVVLVLSAHLLPALLRDVSGGVRWVGYWLWAACMLATINSHAYFFLLAQQHAAQIHADAAPLVRTAPLTRSLTVVMGERADVLARLEVAHAQSCSRICTPLVVRRAALAARLDALEAEASDIRRAQTVDERSIAQHDALTTDPVTTRLAALLGTTGARVDLLTGLVFAAVLEGVTCLLWRLALQSLSAQPVATVVPAVAPLVTQSHEGDDSGRHGHALPDAAISQSPAPETGSQDVAQLARDIAAGQLRATVADIRRHLGCSQARAIALRRQLADRS